MVNNNLAFKVEGRILNKLAPDLVFCRTLVDINNYFTTLYNIEEISRPLGMIKNLPVKNFLYGE